jgi:transcriptional regulator with XRE-family HTH domain
MAKREDPIMARARERFEQAGISLEELGRRMGYNANARKSAWQFLHKTSEPRLSMLRRFAKALGIDLKDLL